MEDSGDDPSRYARRPPNAFLIFCKKNRSVVRRHHPNVENRNITRILGDCWSHLDPEQKVVYIELANKNKDEFLKANPDFKWYKLPAPPLRHLGTRPSNQQLMNKQNLISSSSSISPGKLADDTQLGGIASLLSPPKPPNKRYLELNYSKLEEKSSVSIKNLISSDCTIPFVHCEVKKEPLELNEEEEGEKSSIKTELDSEDSGLSLMSSNASINSSNIRNSTSESCGEPGNCAIGSSEEKCAVKVSNHVNKSSMGKSKHVSKHSIILSPISSSNTSQQMIIECVVDNSFINDKSDLKKELSISNYNCSTTSDTGNCHKLRDEYTGMNGVLNDGSCVYCEKEPLSECVAESTINTTTRHHNLNGVEAADSTTGDFGDEYLENNDKAHTYAETHKTVTSPSGGNDVSSNNFECDSNLEEAACYNAVDMPSVVHEKLNRNCKGALYSELMGSSRMDEPEIRNEEFTGIRKSERLKLSGTSTSKDNRNSEKNSEREILELPMEKNFNILTKVKTEDFYENVSSTEVKTEILKFETDFIIKCEDKFSPKNFINLKFEKEIEELPPLNYEEYQLKKKEKRRIKPVTFFSDHDYVCSNREPRKRRASSMNSHNQGNSNVNSTTTSNDEPTETKYLYKKRWAYNMHLNSRDARGFPKATASIGNEQLSVKIPLSPSSYQAQTSLSYLSGSRKRKASKKNIIHLEPGTSCKDTSVVQEAALALIAFSDAAYSEINALSK